jgi:hypothetical protein
MIAAITHLIKGACVGIGFGVGFIMGVRWAARPRYEREYGGMRGIEVMNLYRGES